MDIYTPRVDVGMKTKVAIASLMMEDSGCRNTYVRACSLAGRIPSVTMRSGRGGRLDGWEVEEIVTVFYAFLLFSFIPDFCYTPSFA